jgi:hypothetical protein
VEIFAEELSEYISGDFFLWFDLYLKHKINRLSYL